MNEIFNALVIWHWCWCHNIYFEEEKDFIKFMNKVLEHFDYQKDFDYITEYLDNLKLETLLFYTIKKHDDNYL